MGGRKREEVRALQKAGIPAIALKMGGSVPRYADLVATDLIRREPML